MGFDLYTLSKTKIGPVLCDYTYWVLCEARKRSISILYFLARDGYVLREIAEEICRQKNISIECRYLYCSRASLRMPSYHLIGEEAYDLLFISGYHVSIRSFFERAMIEEKYWKTILAQSNLPQDIDLDRELLNRDLSGYKEQFMQSETFQSLVRDNSKNAYWNAIRYFDQEGLLKQEHIGIVDSGWTGSMQRSLRQLIQSEGYCGQITGFYFGLYTTPHDPADGEYLSWYFSENKNKMNKVLFCNNLFECFLSAPHGMTTRYENDGTSYKPFVNPAPDSGQLERIQNQILGLLDGAKGRIKNGMTTRRTASEQILRHIMGCPKQEIVETYGKFMFCDDITESYHFSLADHEQEQALKDCTVFRRFVRKISRKQAKLSTSELFWPYGTAALVANPVKRMWYWLNIYIWQWLKFTLQ